MEFFTVSKPEDVNYLVKLGKDINFVLYGDTPFTYFCKKNNIDIVVALLNHGCDISYKTFRGKGLPIVCKMGYSDLLVQMLTFEPVKSTINDTDHDCTCIGYACFYGHVDIYDILIKNGGNPLLYGSNGNTNLSITSNLSIVENICTDFTECINQRENDGTTAIFHCSNVDILSKLLVYGADPNIKSNDSQTPLYRFCYNENVLFVKILLHFGVDVDLPNDCGRTPLMIAIFKRNPQIIRLLIQYGADIHITDDKNKSSWDYISEIYSSDEIATLL